MAVCDRLSFDDDGEIDEITASNVSIHIERMNDGHIWISIARGNDAQIVNLCTVRGAKIIATTVQETCMPKAPTKVRGIPVKGVKLKDGKLELIDKGAAHPVVRARRQRTKHKITGARPAK